MGGEVERQRADKGDAFLGSAKGKEVTWESLRRDSGIPADATADANTHKWEKNKALLKNLKKKTYVLGLGRTEKETAGGDLR